MSRPLLRCVVDEGDHLALLLVQGQLLSCDIDCPVNIQLVTNRMKHYVAFTFASISSRFLVDLFLEYGVQCQHAALDLVLAELSRTPYSVENHLNILLFIELDELMLLEDSCRYLFAILTPLCLWIEVMSEELDTLLVAEFKVNERGTLLVTLVDVFFDL